MADVRQQQSGGGGREGRGGDAGGAAPARFTGDVTIELGDDRNRIFLWSPTQDQLRGSWKRANLRPNELVDELAQMPDIPGIRIQIDGEKRVLRIYDPLGTPEFESILTEAAQVYKMWFGDTIGPMEPKVFEKASNDQVKTWLYWARRFVNGSPLERKGNRVVGGGPSAAVVAGSLPSLDEIGRFPGRIRVSHFSSSSVGRNVSYEDVIATRQQE